MRWQCGNKTRRSQLALLASACQAAAYKGREAAERVTCLNSTLPLPDHPQRLSTRCAWRTRSSWCSTAASTCSKVSWDSNCLLHYGTNVYIGFWWSRTPSQHHCCSLTGANMPCSDRAVHHLEDNGVLFGPGKAANAGMGWWGLSAQCVVGCSSLHAARCVACCKRARADLALLRLRWCTPCCRRSGGQRAGDGSKPSGPLLVARRGEGMCCAAAQLARGLCAQVGLHTSAGAITSLLSCNACRCVPSSSRSCRWVVGRRHKRSSLLAGMQRQIAPQGTPPPRTACVGPTLGLCTHPSSPGHLQDVQGGG